MLSSAIQTEFNKQYNYLKLEFQGSLRVGIAAVKGDIEVQDNMTVEELETLVEKELGRPARVLRKSGNLWLETDMTRHWTLRQQNDHGLEIAIGFMR
jgi:hypothetical protein